ncbi:MAG: Txe/YoeB family addiction module toxin [Planctomycetaceae bacterium]|nr:Txe/YoeB family addiction module toxin [Planctomycetaceae bacterium]
MVDRKSSTSRHSKPNAVFHAEFRDDLRYWIEQDRKVATRLLELVEAVIREPFSGIGKPEPLKGPLAGCWSRRITREHRLVYVVDSSGVQFLQARYHY